MRTTLVREYTEARRKAVPASQAILIARAESAARKDRIVWKNERGTERATWEQDGFTITVRQQQQEDVSFSDMDFYGRLEETRDDNGHRRVIFTPGYRDYYDDARKGGMSKGAARDYERESNARDRKRIEDYGQTWSFVGIIATATRAGIELGEASVWGVESDGDDAYIDECARDEASEAISEAKAALARLCGAK